ncbi:MAG: FAD-binding oxidoreductase [Gammaproteobacteria bacterium]|nr:FAD-binding oxidoreductase [Gammaproteobacteria bacterium]
MKKSYSWGRYPVIEQSCQEVFWRDQELIDAPSMLPYGQGRSYGDVCVNEGGVVLQTSKLHHYINLDESKGILRAESGTTLEQILKLIVPKGWFLPVTPGTKYVSLGGAVANDVHGKNHHRAGSFGCHVLAFELLRSNGERLICTNDQNQELFHATIGGLGLTGLITWVEIKLKPIASSYIHQQVSRFKNLEDFIRLNESEEANWEYTVAWIDCLAKGRNLGKGLYLAGKHDDDTRLESGVEKNSSITMPIDAPSWLLNRASVQLFNSLYYRKPRKKLSRVYYDGYFYPLDKIAHWNRMYGKRGFFQYQCVVPVDEAESALSKILEKIARSGQGSFLSVLKKFGNNPAPGLLSFPRSGFTLALDFANRGEKTLQLFSELDEITMHYGGAVYPAKDARMSAMAFKQFFPAWENFSQYIDPHFSSSFWRRVNQ